MNFEVFKGLMIPFIGTVLGSGCVYFLKKDLSERVHKSLLGFAGGVMVAASIWSLILPAMEQVEETLGKMAFVPIAIGFLAGIFFLLILDKIIPHLHQSNDKPEGIKANFRKSTMLILAVTLHNIPEGMAVGVVFSGWLNGNQYITLLGAMVLSIGIAIQNFPEGAVISMPLRANGMGKHKAFVAGALSGIVEPIAAAITIMAAGIMVPILPYMLSFAAGAMIYVVVEELIPEMSSEEHADIGTIMFSIGFVIMMSLDVALG